MTRVIISPNTMEAVNVLDSETASIMGALIRRRRKGSRATATFSVSSLGCEVTYVDSVVVEASTFLQSQLIDLIAVARIACVIVVRKVKSDRAKC